MFPFLKTANIIITIYAQKMVYFQTYSGGIIIKLRKLQIRMVEKISNIFPSKRSSSSPFYMLFSPFLSFFHLMLSIFSPSSPFFQLNSFFPHQALRFSRRVQHFFSLRSLLFLVNLTFYFSPTSPFFNAKLTLFHITVSFFISKLSFFFLFFFSSQLLFFSHQSSNLLFKIFFSH